mgnify:FL=1
MTRTRSSIVLLTALALVAAACGDDGAATTEPAAAGTTTTTAPTTTTAAATPTTTAPATTATTEPMSVELPPTGVTAILDQAYEFGENEADSEEWPFPIGAIEAHWYQAGEVYAVVYFGLDLEETGPLCPGNSIVGDDGLAAHVSNSPTPDGVCGDGLHIAEPPRGVLICGGVVSYLTEIPNGTSGWLYASLEYYPATGVNFGVTSLVEADPDYMAAIDPALLDCP